jgi:hypothetical protein
LDTLREVPRIVNKNDLMINTDEKSGYDHVFLSRDSRTYFGVTFAGRILRYNTLPFGFKAACFVYQKIGLCATIFLRDLGIPVLQYIDDRLFNVSLGPDLCGVDGKLYAILQLLTRLGYTISIHKSVLSPTRSLDFLGFTVDSEAQVFRLPEKKRESFNILRNMVLEEDRVDLLTLQKLAGKCSSMAICVPGALFYIREMTRAIGQAQKSKKPVPLVGSLREEVEHWGFLDLWQGESQWRKETHTQIKIATDASLYKWGAHVLSGVNMEDGLQLHDYFGGSSRPIHVKEAEAVLRTIESLGNNLCDSRVTTRH